jgi:hypothetical protein
MNKSDLLKVFFTFTDDNAELMFNYEDRNGKETTDRKVKPFKIEYEEDDDSVLITGLCAVATMPSGIIDWQQRKFYLESMSCIRVYKEIRYTEMLASKAWSN